MTRLGLAIIIAAMIIGDGLRAAAHRTLDYPGSRELGGLLLMALGVWGLLCFFQFIKKLDD